MESFFSCLPAFLIQKVFQRLEAQNVGFSKPWKISRNIFQGLEKYRDGQVGLFQVLETRAADFPRFGTVSMRNF